MTDARVTADNDELMQGREAIEVATDSAGRRALAARAAAGDAAATSALLKALGPRVVQVVRAIVGRGDPDVDDIAQQALIRFIQALGAFRGECEPARYATTIAVRTAISARRRSRLERARRDADADTDAEEAPHTELGEQLASQRRREVLRELLAELPEEQAEALAMRVVLGWSLEEIAAQSGAPLNTVRSRLRLAKESLRRTIESQPELCELLEVAR